MPRTLRSLLAVALLAALAPDAARAQIVCDGGIAGHRVFSQQNVDELAQLGCTYIPSLTIFFDYTFPSVFGPGVKGDPIRSLAGLSTLTSIGTLRLLFSNYPEGADTSTLLAGLQNVETITGNLHIEGSGLTSLAGLEGLTSVGHTLSLVAIYTLTSLDGLQNLRSIGDWLEIVAIGPLTSLDGLEGLTSVGEIHIDASSLTACSCGLVGLATETDGAFAFTGVAGRALFGNETDGGNGPNAGDACNSAEAVLAGMADCRTCADPAAALDALNAAVATVAAEAGLNKGLTRALSRKATQARTLYERGNPDGAAEVLAGLARQADALYAEGKLTQAQRDALAAAVAAVDFALGHPCDAAAAACAAPATMAPATMAPATAALTAGEAFGLDAPAPNPAAGGAVRLGYRLAEAGAVRLAVYDALGREVAVVAAGAAAAGAHAATLDAAALPAGAYVVRLSAGARSATARLTILR